MNTTGRFRLILPATCSSFGVTSTNDAFALRWYRVISACNFIVMGFLTTGLYKMTHLTVGRLAVNDSLNYNNISKQNTPQIPKHNTGTLKSPRHIQNIYWTNDDDDGPHYVCIISFSNLCVFFLSRWCGCYDCNFCCLSNIRKIKVIYIYGRVRAGLYISMLICALNLV